MNKSMLYVLILAVAVVAVAAQDQTTPTPAVAQATPTPPPVADITPTPDMSATPQAVATPVPNATVEVAPTPVVAVSPVATHEVAPTATPVAVASATPTPAIALTNRKDTTSVPSDIEMYCSGFITPHAEPTDTYVVGGIGSPQQTRFQGNDTIYLHGPTLPTGSKILLLRRVSDPMIETEAYPGQKKLDKKYDNMYQELGIATINGVMNHVMTATFNLVCDSVVVADLAIPLPDRIRPAYRPQPVSLEHIGEPNGKLTGRIVFANEYDWILGTGSRVYLNVGGDQVKPGDYLRITRTYESTRHDPLDYLDYMDNTDEPSRKPTGSKLHNAMMGHDKELPALNAKIQVGAFPRRTVGEMMVLYTSGNSATAKITSAFETVYIGDNVELEDQSPDANTPPVAVVDIPGNGSTSAGLNPPVITCQAQSPSVHAGEAATVVCTATSADNHPVTVAFETSRGHIQAQDRVATVDTRGLDPGALNVKATATDDRNLSSWASTAISVQPPVAAEAPTPSKVADLAFKRNSSYVDNRSKAALDDIALRLQKDPTSTAVVVGTNATGEPATLAEQRAKNAGIYLTKDKGIGADRIQSQAGAAGNSGAAVWIVPPGANMPDTNTTMPTNPQDNSTPGVNPQDNTTTPNPGVTNNSDQSNNPPVIDPGSLIPHNRPVGPPETR